jgi:hypothetical protein
MTPDPREQIARRVVFAVGVCALIGFAAPFVDRRLWPLAKWPLLLWSAFMALVFARFFPAVWEFRRDDKFPVIFIGLLVLLSVWFVFHVASR